MQTPTIDATKAATPLKDVVESPRAKKALEAAGLRTLGDVWERGIGSLHGMRNVGEASIGLIRKALGLVEEKPSDLEETPIEEGVHPIRLECAYPEFRLQVCPAHRLTQPNGAWTLEREVYIEFDRGHGTLSKRAWLMRKFNRDKALVEKGMAAPNLHWRAEAIAWLRSRDPVKMGTVHILED